MKYTSIRLQKSRSADEHPSAVHLPITKFTPGGFHIRNVDGLGMPEITVNLTSATDNRMASYNGSRSTNRQIVITASMYPDYATGLTISDLRDSVYRLASPADSTEEYVRLDLLKADGSIYLNTWGYISKIDAPQFTKEPLIQITLECIPIHLRGNTALIYSSATGTVDINNHGTAPTSLKARIKVGAQSNPIVLVIMRGDKELFRLQHAEAFREGDLIDIDTDPNARKVTLTRGTSITNLLRYVAMSSKWFDIPTGPDRLSAVGNTTPNPYSWENVTILRQYWGA